jgi:hypothetical protein
MRAVGDNNWTASNTAQIAMARTRALQKLKPASDLHAETGDNTSSDAPAFENQRSGGLCHSGTEGTVPFRYGLEAPRLNAAFVAQLLGQMMPDREPHNCGALAIYDGAPATALFCDKHL